MQHEAEDTGFYHCLQRKLYPYVRKTFGRLTCMFGISPCLFTARQGTLRTLPYFVVVPITLALTSNYYLDLIPLNPVNESYGILPNPTNVIINRDLSPSLFI